MPAINKMMTAITSGIQNGESTQIQGQVIWPVNFRPTNSTPRRVAPDGQEVVVDGVLLILGNCEGVVQGV